MQQPSDGCRRRRQSAKRVKPMLSLSRRLILETEDRLRCAEPGKREFAECREFTRAVAGKFSRGEDGASELAGQLFDARCKIDRGPDAGEIEAIAAADIAVEDIADVQCQAEAQSQRGRA